MLSFPTGGQEHDSKEDWTKFCQDIRGQNLVQSSLLSLLTGNQAERIEPNFARTLAGKTWSNPLCCHFLQVVKDVTAKRIGPNFASKSLLSFHTGGQGHDSREDWTKFCQNIRGHNLVQSSLLSLPTGNQAERIGPTFARTLAGKIWSNPLCCHSLPVTKQRGLNQILPGHSPARFGPILSAAISYRWPRT